MTDIEVLRARLMALTQRPPIGSPLSPRVKSTTTLVPSSQDDFAFLDASTRFDPSDKDLLETGCWFHSDDPRLDHRREDNIRSPPLPSRNDIEQRHPQTLLHCTISPVANSNRQVDHVTIVPREHNDFVYRTSRRICFDKATSVGVEIDSISPTGFTSVVRDGSPVYAEAEEQLNGSGEHNSLITHNSVNDKNGKSDFVRNGRIQIKIPIEGINEAENENTLTPSSIWTHPSKTDISETATCNETEGNASKSGSKQHRITRSNTWDQSNYYEVKDQGERQVKNVELQTDFPSDSECESVSKDPQIQPVKRNGDDRDGECDSLTELFTTVF